MADGMAEQLCITVTLDRALGLSLHTEVPKGATVRELAEVLAAGDPTGLTDAGELRFRLPATPSGAAPVELDRELALGAVHAELELLNPAEVVPEEPPAPTLGAWAPEPAAPTEPVVPREPATPAARELAAPWEPLEPVELGLTPEGRGAIYAISDTHCEAKPNMEWLEDLPTCPNDTIIVAGDLAVEISQIEKCLQLFVEKYKRVFYCFGNHECWTHNKHGFETSFEKIAAIRAVCDRLGVETRSSLVDGVWIVPVFGWYHSTWDTEPPLQPPPGSRLKRDPRAAHKMSNDYVYCRWGDLENGSEALAAALDMENEAFGSWPLPDELLHEASLPPGKRKRPIVSFSHFLPRIELFLEKRFAMEPNLVKLIGSNWIRDRVDEICPDVHVFGHTHMNWDMRLNDTRYISWPLGMPEEKFWRAAYYPGSDCSMPLKVFDHQGRQCRQEEACFGSRVYEALERDPSSWVMSHRVANKFCPSAPVLFDNFCMPGRIFSWTLPKEPEEVRRIELAAKKMNELSKKHRAPNQEWEVIGGEDRGGIIVRHGAKLDSGKLPERLSTGAIVEELSLQGDRLLYRLLSGTGPETGWVATELPGKQLLVALKMPPHSGDLSLKQVLELQELLLERFSKPRFQRELAELCGRFPGKLRAQAEFAQKHRDLLQCEYDAVLPKYNFPKGNLMQLDLAIAPYLNIVTGNTKAKDNRRRLDELLSCN